MATYYELDVPFAVTDEPTRALLENLAEQYVDDLARPCCDEETTLRDWIDAGLYSLGETDHE